jgi:hypothetical protein
MKIMAGLIDNDKKTFEKGSLKRGKILKTSDFSANSLSR